MIKYIEGNIFDSPAQVIVNTVNTVGVMGKGLALQFKNRYPDMFAKYRTVCEKHQLATGQLMLWHGPDHWVLLFPTKQNWRNPSKLEYIEQGLLKFVNTYTEHGICSIAFPKLGCGNGELAWDDVKPLMEKHLKPLPIDVYIYLGPKLANAPEHKQQEATIEWMRKHAKDMSFNGLKDDIIINTRLIPYSFKYNGACYDAKWSNGLAFECTDTKEQITISEDSFFETWDRIRNKSVFFAPSSDIPQELICALLLSLGYLTEIRLQNSRTSEMQSGYQLNEGAGRLFALKGVLE